VFIFDFPFLILWSFLLRCCFIVRDQSPCDESAYHILCYKFVIDDVAFDNWTKTPK